MLKKVLIVLCRPSHPGNIGAVARAMKNMGLTQLVLVSPNQFPSQQATDRASGADDVLAQAIVVSTFEEAIHSCQWVFGTSARQREFPLPVLTPKQAAEMIKQLSGSEQKIAVVFGNEQSGLSNEELHLCDYHLSIPACPEYSSLNLAAAVQVIAYEIYQTTVNENDSDSKPLSRSFIKANSGEVMGLIKQFEEVAIALKFLDPKHPKKLMTRIKRLFSKAQLETEEVNILRGFLKKIPCTLK
ncbi:MAG: RNA methyltransferase [Candidatus Berkiellales bacterium]